MANEESGETPLFPRKPRARGARDEDLADFENSYLLLFRAAVPP
jgi:hypothetical protein